MTDPEATIRAELGPTEQLLWAGPARTGFLFYTSDWLFIPFIIFFGLIGFSLWSQIIQGISPDWFGTIFVAFFFCAGLYVLIARLLLDARWRSQTAYGVTSERVLIVCGSPRPVISSLILDTLTEIILRERADGSGSITLGPGSPIHGWFAAPVWNGNQPNLVHLELAGEVRRVHEIILGARRDVKET